MASPASFILADLKQVFGDLPMNTSALADGMPAMDNIPTTVSELKNMWQRISGTVAVYEFYGHNQEIWGPSAPLSNFWVDTFPFHIPEVLLQRLPQVHEALPDGPALHVTCSETAIMLMKAILCEDFDSFEKIRKADKTEGAKAVKLLGRDIKNFDQQEWDKWVVFIAIQAVTQKFKHCDSLRCCLAATDKCIIAETVADDTNWATGSNPLEPENQRPCAWRGLNILGLALIVARYILKVDKSQMSMPPEEHEEKHQQGLKQGRERLLKKQAIAVKKPRSEDLSFR